MPKLIRLCFILPILACTGGSLSAYNLDEFDTSDPYGFELYAEAKTGGDFSSQTDSPQGPVDWEDDFHLPPQNSDGFSVFTPSSDTRIVYVSATEGDDSTAAVYDAASPDVGPAPFSPRPSIQPFHTIDAALSELRSGYPDWLLLKGGDTWTVSTPIDAKSGRSPKERFVMGAYGQSGERPRILTGVNSGIRFWKRVRYSAAVGLAFRAHKRDPSDPDFVGFDDSGSAVGLTVYADDDSAPTATVLIEDSTFEFYANNTIQGKDPTVDLVIRRCQFLNNYSARSHSQGLYSSDASILLEESLFDHNGWYKQANSEFNDKTEGQATVFNHNLYFTNSHNTIVRGNVFSRPSSMGNKFTANPDGDVDEIRVENLLVENNLYIDNEVGISAGGNHDQNTGYRWRNIVIQDNVMIQLGQSRPTNRSLGWGLEVVDWDVGRVSDNFFLHTGDADVTNVHALFLRGHLRDVDVLGNTVFGFNASRYAVSFDASPKTRVAFSNNALQFRSKAMKFVDSHYLAPGTFSDNTYFGTLLTNSFSASGEDNTFEEWQDLVGAEGSQFSRIPYPDPDRSVETYMADLGLEPSHSSFMQEMKSQSRDQWRSTYTATAVNAYLRDGFDTGDQ